jgi:putative chitobiose transport system permease protein
MIRKASATPYLFLLPALLLLGVFVFYPIGAVIYYSLTDYDIVRPPVFIGLDNFVRLLDDDTFKLALLHSFIYLIVTPILIVLSIILAIVVNRKLRGIHIYRALYFVPAVSGSIAIGLSWRWLFDRSGVINIIFLAGLQNVPEELYDAARIDGANDFQKHRYVSIPALRPQIVFVAVISSLAALKVFDEIYVLTNRTGGVLDSGVTMVFYLWEQAFERSNAGYASAIAIVLLLVTLGFSVVNVRLLERGNAPGDR